MSTPSTMKAIKARGQKEAALEQSAKVPSLKPDYILVKISHVALNPTDWKGIDFVKHDNCTVGCDYSGTVVDVGSAVNKTWNKGDRVAGFGHGAKAGDPECGCFAEYAVVKGDIQMKTPSSVSDKEAATLGVGVSTVGQGLYQSLGLPMPDAPAKEKIPVLIYGGSTATGLFAIQFAKASNLTVITTCSPRNFDLVKSYGADVAFDYSDPEECSKKIREYTNNNLKHAFDCISEGTSPKICADSLSTASDTVYSALLPVKDFPRSDIKHNHTLAYTVNGEPFTFAGNPVPAKPADFEFGVRFWALAENLMAEGKVKAPPQDVRSGGLDGVMDGLDQLRQGKVSGKKLVYRIGGAS